MDGMGDLDNAPMPPMSPDGGMDDPMGGEGPDDMGGAPDDMGGEPPMGGEDPMGGDEPMDDPMGGEGPDDMGGNSDDDELMSIIDGMSTEDKAAVIKYAKSMVDDEPQGGDEMPMESFRHYKGIIDEVINDVVDDQEGITRPSKKLPKEYKGMRSPFKSPY